MYFIDNTDSVDGCSLRSSLAQCLFFLVDDWRFNIPQEDLEAEEEEDGSEESTRSYSLLDEDADVDESESSGESDDTDGSSSSSRSRFNQIRRETKILMGVIKYLLPAVGRAVEVIDLAHSKSLTNGMVSLTISPENVQ